MLTKDMKELIRAFNEQGVEYLLVGGYAFGVHAQPRATKDLDLFIRADARNSNAVFRALCRYGAPLDGLTAKDFRDAKTGLQIGVPPNRIDILQKISGVTFDEAWKDHVDAIIEGDTPTYVISRENLIRCQSPSPLTPSPPVDGDRTSRDRSEDGARPIDLGDLDRFGVGVG